MNPTDKALLGIIAVLAIIGIVGNIVIHLQNKNRQ